MPRPRTRRSRTAPARPRWARPWARRRCRPGAPARAAAEAVALVMTAADGRMSGPVRHAPRRPWARSRRPRRPRRRGPAGRSPPRRAASTIQMAYTMGHVNASSRPDERDVLAGRDATDRERDAAGRDAQRDPGASSLEPADEADREHGHERRIQVRDDRDERHRHGAQAPRCTNPSCPRTARRAPSRMTSRRRLMERSDRRPVARRQQQHPGHQRREHEAPGQQRQRGHARVVGHPREERAGAEERRG